MPNPLVVVDLTAGAAHVAGATVAVRGQPGGGLTLDGRVIRPLTFGDRCRLIDDASANRRSIGATVLARACDRESAAEPSTGDQIAQILAMHLAGARPERRALVFEAQLSWLVSAGWKPNDVFDTDADLVDLLTADALGTQAEDDWTTILLVPDHAAACSLTEVLLTLEQSLLERMVSTDLDDGVGCRAPHRVALESPPASVAHVERDTGEDTLDVDQPVTAPRGALPSTRGAPASSGPTVGQAGLDLDTSVAPSTERYYAADHFNTAIALPNVPWPIRAGWPGHSAANAGPESGGDDAPTARAPQDPSTVAVRIPEPILTRGQMPSHFQGRRPPNRATPPAGAASTVAHLDPVATRTAPLATRSPAGLDTLESADQLAALLDDESDLRGLRR